MDCPRVRYPQFNDEVEAELAAAGYQVLTGPSEQVDKVVQLYEVMMTRHTTMVVGQTGAAAGLSRVQAWGTTHQPAAWHTLAWVLSRCLLH
jgi:hypothetical protein